MSNSFYITGHKYVHAYAWNGFDVVQFMIIDSCINFSSVCTRRIKLHGQLRTHAELMCVMIDMFLWNLRKHSSSSIAAITFMWFCMIGLIQ